MSRFDAAEFQPREFKPWLGWYQGAVIDSYETRNGKVVRTEDTTSAAGDSRNLVLALILQRKASNGTMETHNVRYSINYREADLNDENIARIRERAGKNKCQFPKGDPDGRAFVTFKNLAQLDVLTGKELIPNGNGFNCAEIVGSFGDFRMAPGQPNQDGKVYEEVKQIAKLGTKVK